MEWVKEKGTRRRKANVERDEGDSDKEKKKSVAVKETGKQRLQD